MEEHLIKERLEQGFFKDGEIDVDSFISFSLSVQNRRKSRAGLSLENHIEALLKSQEILYTHTPVTENKAKPDFIFPCIEAYKDEQYEENYLTMLGAKSTCKDRWRQVLSEAGRISRKHLLTLEPSISTNQTDEMAAIRSKNTKPEIYLRKLLFARGYRYRINVKYISGHPDIYLRKYNTAIFVHGCFWHRHAGCKFAYTPKSRVDFWKSKFETNEKRALFVLKELGNLGIKTLIIWECTIKSMQKDPSENEKNMKLIEAFLNSKACK